MDILGVIIARNETRTVKKALEAFRAESFPFIAILDNPVKEVRWALRKALDVYEMPPQTDADKNGVLRPHIYQWEKILSLVKWAVKRPRKFTWVFRVDADEIWPRSGKVIRAEIQAADEQKFNVVNFGIVNHRPTRLRLKKDEDFEKACPSAEPAHPLFLRPFELNYQRAWKLDGDWNFGGGGHTILRKDPVVFKSKITFDHYPAVDLESLDKKKNRIYLNTEKAKGWHTHYEIMRKTEEKPPEASFNGKIKLFYFVAKMPKWESVYAEQISQIEKAGILEKANFHVIYSGDPSPAPFGNYKTIFVDKSLDKYEFPALHIVWEWCRKNENAAVCYVHTKGVSSPHKFNAAWRRYLMWGCIANWKRCVEALRNGFDSAGVEWIDHNRLEKYNVVNPAPSGFWAGNCWWARSDYIRSLPEPYSLDIKNRYYAEAWIGLKNPVVKCFHDTRTQFDGHFGWECASWTKSWKP